MKKFILYYAAIVGCLCGILLMYVLSTTYEFTYCYEGTCITSKQKIFDYMIGRN